MNNIMKKLLLAVFLFFVVNTLFAQTDTAFWFAAPDVSSSNSYDRPIVFRISSSQLSSTVVLSQPANITFIPITITLAPFSTQTIDVTSQLTNIECQPANAILNKGIKITATSKIAVYYEVNLAAPNPEIFSLKGKNALGIQFYISSQNVLNNSNAYSVTPLSSFNIVATEDNTSITIIPTKNIVGHTANIPFTITLNKGQTYAAEASSQAANQHLDGSYVSANKPIAITLEDDLLEGGGLYGGLCQDLAGDQTVPFTSLGTEYIAIRSQLNFPYDKVFITATQNGTTVNQDGIFVTNLAAGQSATLSVSNPSTYIETSLPAYAYQLAGAGCEMASAILPKIGCSGNSTVSITRSSPEGLIITLVVKNGNQANFLINNTAGIITAAQFSVVPGTGGIWYFAKINLPIGSYPNGSTVRIANTSSLFQFGFMQGGVLSGLSFGYFSDFNTIRASVFTTNAQPCAGTNLTLNAETIPSATYSWTGPNGYTSNNQNPVINNVTIPLSGYYVATVTVPGCGIYKDSTNITVLPKTFSTINQTICQGTTYAGYGTAGQYVDIFAGTNGCDSTRTLNLTIKPKSFKTISQTICEGQSFETYTTSGTYVNTFIAANGCDSVRTLILTVKPKSLKTISQSICEGQSFEGYTTSGTYINTFVAYNGCDSVRTLILTVNPKSLKTIAQSICEGQSFEGYTTSGTYLNTFVAANGCDSIRTLILSVNPKTFSTINQLICQGTTYAGYGTAGQYIDIFAGANGCDSTRTLNLTIKPKSFKTVNQTICEGQSFEGYTTSDTYFNTFVAANGCDSIRTLNLTVKLKSSYTINKTICEGDVFEGYTAAGNYTNTFIAANGCDSVRKLNLNVLKYPKPNLGPDVSVCFSNKFLLSPGIFDSFTWQDGSLQNTFSAIKAGLYSVKVTNACGFASDTIIISNKSCEVFFPNVFTPNSDTKNDFFKILNAINLTEYKLMIYNRWGEKVFETNDYTKGWDGNYKAAQAEIGSYVWYSSFIKDGKQKSLKGSVLLIR
jgi:gliding motility-associated-like protein